MKLIAGEIYLTTSELVQAGVSSEALSKASRRGTVEFIKDPSDKRVSLFAFNGLPERYKTFTLETFGNPLDYYNSQELKNLVVEDRNGFDFFSSFRFSDGTGLPTEHVLKYTKAASWLNMLSQHNHKTTGHGSAAEFYAAVCKLLKAEKVELPKSYARLKKALKKYKEEGYQGLISTKFGNSNAEVLGEVQKAYLREVYANKGQAQIFLPVQVAMIYKKKAAAEGWQQVTDRCIFDYLNRPEVQVLCGRDRYGKKELLNFTPVINRSKPSQPNAIWGIDGSPFELAYKEEGRSKRLYVFMVIDYYSNKWLSMSISETETGETVLSAIKKACILNNCLPHQIQSDNSSAIMRCKEQLEQIATYFTPAKVGWARSKPIEAVQGHINSTILKWFPNHSGANITAKSKDRKVNPEEVAKALPDKATVIRQIYEAQQLWNSRPNAKGVTPNELYQHQQPKLRVLDAEARIRLFGVPRRKPVTYTNEGITLTIDGEDVKFFVPDADFYVNHYREKFLVKIDPEDASMIGLFSPEDGRFVEWAFEKTLVPMAELDHTKKTKREFYKQLKFQEKVQAAGERDAEERAKILDAETTSKIPLGVNGVFKDQLNEAADAIKNLELVGIINEDIKREEKPSLDLYKSEEGDSGRIL